MPVPVSVASPARSLARLVAAACVALPAAAVAPPAVAQSAASRVDQPTAGTLPPGTSTVEGGRPVRGTGDGRLPPPSALRSDTDVMASDGSDQARGTSRRTDPVQHLPQDMR